MHRYFQHVSITYASNKPQELIRRLWPATTSFRLSSIIVRTLYRARSASSHSWPIGAPPPLSHLCHLIMASSCDHKTDRKSEVSQELRESAPSYGSSDYQESYPSTVYIEYTVMELLSLWTYFIRREQKFQRKTSSFLPTLSCATSREWSSLFLKLVILLGISVHPTKLMGRAHEFKLIFLKFLPTQSRRLLQSLR